MQPGDKNALCSRSRCRLMMGDARGALDDAEEALANDSLCVKGSFFFHALLAFHKKDDEETFYREPLIVTNETERNPITWIS